MLPLLAIAIGTLLLGSCAKESSGPDAFEVVKEYRQGPVAVTLKVGRKTITVADRLKVVLEVTADEDYTVELPKFEEKSESFTIADTETPILELTAGKKTVHRVVWTLEPFLAGDYMVPPLKVGFGKKGQAKPEEFQTEPVKVVVTSLLPANPAGRTIQDIVPPVDLPRPWTVWLWALLPLGLIGAVLGTRTLTRRRNGREKLTPKIPAHELAFGELDRLLAQRLVEQGQFKLFYFGVSEILRRYIENRFGLHAPERTTEEFLAELQADGMLDPGHKLILKEFLGHCDLVKFAEVTPTGAEVQKTLATCRQFIEETKSPTALVTAEGRAA